ncbi:MAG: ABC transporter substrate-binding protein [Thermomicrobiales bacterium]
MSTSSPSAPCDQRRAGSIDRRTFVHLATAAGMTAGTALALASSAGAQATPGSSPGASPAASPMASPAGPMTRSVTRDDYLAQLRDHFAFTEAASTGGEVIYANSSDIETVNPLIRVDTYALFLVQNMFNSLVTQSVIDGTVVPDLADYWETSADFRTVIFHINANATWHDGKPVTADDVLFSFQAAMDASGVSPYRSDLVANLASITAIDEKTVRLDAIAAHAVFLNKTALLVPIMPKHIWESIPVANWGSAPGSTGTDPSQVIGSGPFRFVEWVANDHATMERWDQYWVPEMIPAIDKGTYRVVPDLSTAIQTLKTGESDIVTVPPQQIKDFDGSTDVTVATYDDWSWTLFSPQQDPAVAKFCHQKEVRQALMYALDRDGMVEGILAGNATVAEGLQPIPSRAYAPDRLSTHYTYDVEKAKSLLESAGWVDSDGDGIREKDGVKFSTEFYYDSSDPASDQIVAYLQQAWKEIGVDITPTTLAQSALIEQIVGKNDYQLALFGLSWTEEDQGILYRTDSWPDKGGFNVSRYSNPEFDALNDEQLKEFDDAKRMAIIEESNNILNDDVAVGLMYFNKGAVGFQNRVQNYPPNAFGTFWQLPFVWINQ